MTDQYVTRLYGAIVDAMRQRGSPNGPVTVADLYQDIVPYRDVRSALGVELNADYEHAMLRLLAGEHGLLRLEPESAQAELRKEVAQPYPSVGLYRKFAGSSVWVTLPDDDFVVADPESVPAGTGPSRRDDATVRAAPSATPGPRPADTAPADTAPADTVPAPPGVPDRDAADTSTGPAGQPAARQECHSCGTSLPTGREVLYCPACGADQRLRPCPECGEVLESDWRFCIACGRESTL